MVRTQIQLDVLQASDLKEIAARERCSMAEVIRQAIDAYLSQTRRDGDEHKRQRALRAIGAFEVEPRLALEHDAAFTESEVSQ
jgi:Arc/MetJ-type ribon-helix-helix transcriptional regulator